MAHRLVKKMVAVLTSVVLAAGIFTGCDLSVSAASNSINGHQFVTEVSDYRLYVNEEDLSVVVENKSTGAYMESSISYDDGKNNDTWLGAMKSAVVITMINGSDDTKQADLVNDNVKKTITYTDNGFKADLYWLTYKFGFTLEVALTDEGLVARIPDETIREDGEKYYIGTIAIYPYMGTSYLDEKEGYMFVPDGNGALIYLNDKEGRFKSGFSSMIYGTDIGFDESNVLTLLKGKYNTIEDANKILAPVYGIAHTDEKIAYLAVVEEGEARATIEAAPNGASVDYNRAYAKFILRKTYTQPTSNNSTSGSLHIFESERSHSNLGVRFIFLNNEKANYAGMANAYRDYLIKNNQLSIQDNSYNTRIDFLGSDRESWVIGTSAVVMTTVEDIYEIYDDLKANEVTDILSVYKGWQKGGLYSLPITKYKVDSNLGSKNDLTKLIKDADERGIDLYLYNDALIINPEEENATFNVVKKINKRRFELETYRDVYEKLLYLTPLKSNLNIQSFVKSYTKEGVDKLAMAGISNTLFSYTYSGNTYTRFDTQKVYKDTAANVDEATSLVLEAPAAYLWNNTESFLDMPLYTSNYIYEDENIPFLSIVLKGVMPVYSEYINYEANKKEMFLKMVETGTFPSFYITKESSAELIYTNSCDNYSSEYASYKSTIVEYTNALKALDEKVNGANIIGHEILEKVVKVTYSNGVTVYVNYGDTAATVDNVKISAMSYEVVNR